jgi:hypothetical protein
MLQINFFSTSVDDVTVQHWDHSFIMKEIIMKLSIMTASFKSNILKHIWQIPALSSCAILCNLFFNITFLS